MKTLHIACRALWWLYQELFASWKLTRILFSTILAFVLLKDECDEKFDVQNTFWQNPITNDKRHWGENFIIWGIVYHQILTFFDLESHILLSFQMKSCLIHIFLISLILLKSFSDTFFQWNDLRYTCPTHGNFDTFK